MFFVSARFTRLLLISGAALAVTACGGGGETVDESANQSLDSNLLFEQPANDASALESVADAPEPVPATEESTTNSTDDAPVTGNSSGGDTGGNTAEGEDVVGM